MDPSSLAPYLAGGIPGAILAVAYVAYRLCRHFRCHSSCCGRDSDLAVDVDGEAGPHTPLAPT